MTAREQLKTWFSTGKFPTQQQFAEWIDSFFHLDEDTIVISQVEGLQEALNGKAPAESSPDEAEPITLVNTVDDSIELGDKTVYNSFLIDYTLIRGALTEMGTMRLDTKDDALVSYQAQMDESGFVFSKVLAGNIVRLAWSDSLGNGTNGLFYITRIIKTKIQ